MFAKGWRKKDFLERRGQISYQKAWAAAMMTSLDAFFAGIGFGFLGTEILAVGLILELVTLIFALAGTFVGYRLGYEQRTKAYAIGGIILIIAGINFTNFSTALTPMRVKSINTQKVLGSSDGVLRFSLLMEAVCISTVAYLLALWMVHMADNSTRA